MSPKDKILRQVLHTVATLPLQQRVAVLRMGMQLMLQKLHDNERERDDENLPTISFLAAPPRSQSAADSRAAKAQTAQGRA